jgi:hypothetical protein
MCGVPEQRDQQDLLIRGKNRIHPVNVRVHHDGQNIGERKRTRRRSERERDAVPTRKLREVLRLHAKDQEPELVRGDLVEIPRLEQEPAEGILVQEEPQMSQM